MKKNNHNKILDSLLRYDNGTLFIYFISKIVFLKHFLAFDFLLISHSVCFS